MATNPLKLDFDYQDNTIYLSVKAIDSEKNAKAAMDALVDCFPESLRQDVVERLNHLVPTIF